MGDLVNPHFVVSWSEGDHDDGPSFTVALYAEGNDEPVDFHCPDDDGISDNYLLCKDTLDDLAAEYGLDLKAIKIVWDI